MNLLYLTQVFETDLDPGSDRHFFLCKHLVRRGHHVTAITSNVDYKRARARYPGKRGTFTRQVDGVEIRYVYSYPHLRGSLLRRFLYFLTYMMMTLREGRRVANVDVVYAVSTPLTVGLLGYLLSRFHGVPFVFEVTDVWPDAAVATGVVRDGLLVRAASWLEKYCYRHATLIVALTRGIRDNIAAKGVPIEKLLVITNGVDASLFSRPAAEAAGDGVRGELGLHGQFVCMYLGAHGKYNALGTVIDAAEALRDRPRFVFLLVGDGDEKQALLDAARSRRLENVRFLPAVARAETPRLLQAADVFVLPNLRGPFFHMNLPNKLFDFLVSAKPIVVAGEGESADLVRAAGAGEVVEAEDGRAVAAALVSLADVEEANRAAMGERGRAHVLAQYDRRRLCDALALELEAVIG